MKTKTKKVFLISTLFMGALFLSSCNTSAEKVADAEAEVVEAKEDLAESENQLKETRLDSIQDYLQFKKQAEQELAEQENYIAEFKARLKSRKREVKEKYKEKLDDLENQRKDLKRKLAGYTEEGNAQWLSFKREFSHDLSELGAAISDFTVNNEN